MADWKQIFTYTKQERNGIAVLAVVLASAVIYLFLQPALFAPATMPTEIPEEYFAAKKEAEYRDSAFASRGKEDHVDMAKIAGQKTIYQQNELFLFNPNGLAEADWVRLGLSPAQAKSVKNFEDKGGFFRTKEDVKKLFVISAEKYKELEPYIVIPQREQSYAQRSDSTWRREKPQREQIMLELNTADTAQLVKLDSIGPVLAQRIVAYRSRLGGFHSTEQLREVYGLNEAKYKTIQSSFRCDSSYVAKINVNTATVSELKQHPYVTPTVATALVNYRKQHGNFRQLSDIMLCKVITPELYAKLVPYLSL